MNFISTNYNMYHNNIEITTFDCCIFQICCNKTEDRLKTTAWIDHVLNSLAIYKPLEYVSLFIFLLKDYYTHVIGFIVNQTSNIHISHHSYKLPYFSLILLTISPLDNL